MNIHVESVNPCSKRLKIEIPVTHVQEKLTTITHQFQKIAKIPGFRPGHIPIDIVKKRFQAEIEAELKETLVEEAYNQALKEKNITPVAPAKIEDLNYIPDTTFSLSILIDCEPQFPLPPYKALKLTKHDNTIPQEEIDKTIHSLHIQHATYQDIKEPRPLALEDFAVLDYQATLRDQPLETIHPELKQIAKKKNFWIHVLNDTLTLFPGFVQACIGMEIGQSRTFTINLPDTFEYPAIAGQPLQFTVTLNAIKKRDLPPLDDAFAKKFQHDTLESFKTAIHTYHQRTRDQEIEAKAKAEALDKLTSAVQFEIPQTLIDKETNEIYQNIIEENKARGIPIATLEEKQDEILKQAATRAKDNVKARIILNKIAKAENIEATQEELYTRIMALADRYKTPPKKFINQIQKNGSLPSINNQIILEKTLDYILSQAIYE
jgi:trigger factor